MKETTNLPLSGKRIAVTRATEQALEFVSMLEATGAEVIPLPLIQIGAPVSWEVSDRALAELSTFHWVIFTSINAVNKWTERAEQLNRLALLRTNRVGAVGEATARRIQQIGFSVSLIPENFTARGILDALDQDLGGQRILLPRGDRARNELPDELRRRGAEVVEAVVYQTLPAPAPSSDWMARIMKGEFDVVTFVSPSAVHQFVQWVGESNSAHLRRCFHFASIGPTTSDALREHGFEVRLEAKGSSLEALTEAIIHFYEAS